MNKKILVFSVLIILLGSIAVYSKNSNQVNKKIKLTVGKVVNYLLNNNYDVKQILIDYKSSKSPLLSFRGIYDYNLYGEVGRTYENNPRQPSPFEGDSTTINSYGFGVVKKISTGTSFNLGFTGYKSSVKNLAGASGYQTGLRLEITQELLKNSFGVVDRKNEKKILNNEKVQKKLTKQKLANLLIDAIIGYWNIAVAEENLKTVNVNYDNSVKTRNLVRKKLKLGLSEKEGLLDWKGKVLKSRNNLNLAEKALYDAKLNMVRILNLDSSSNIEIGETFVTVAPTITFENALKDAFEKRIDWYNSKIAIENAKIDYGVATSSLLPSLKLKLAGGNKDFDTDAYYSTLNDINSEYEISLALTYPLENSVAKANMTDAKLNIKKTIVNHYKLKKEIRDEIDSLVKECDVTYKVYLQTKEATSFARRYYQQVFIKFNRGRYSRE